MSKTKGKYAQYGPSLEISLRLREQVRAQAHRREMLRASRSLNLAQDVSKFDLFGSDGQFSREERLRKELNLKILERRLDE
ncbi:hypothetical protein NPIL_295551 [Nephila pilipes]|uniref:Uncharacterized protein n=1 Tax=Nephila pilipes TaxID=299642 RepID=A0A8X6UVI3_NEPPI|nr:hypothetical protein NPIL_295551 [Nephila pilipes]